LRTWRLVSLLRQAWKETTMNGPRYLPATRTKVRSLRLGRVSVRSADDRELGKLAGFVVDPEARHLCSLVMEVVGAAGSQQVELPMVPLCFDAESHALRLVDPGVPATIAFRPESMFEVEEDDLWIPIVHSAA
jgi:hypothetical protein